MPAECKSCLESEISLQHIAALIAEQRSPAEILNALCLRLGPTSAERQVAFFLLDRNEWMLAANGDLTPQSRAALAKLVPENLSSALFESWATETEPAIHPVDAGWARHLNSGTGELFGIAVGFADGPALPLGLHAAHIESLCRLATLALEQNNLIGEVAFKAVHDSTPATPASVRDDEIAMQLITRMIARQCEPEEILNALCTHASQTRDERQIGVFLLGAKGWELVAKGDLTSQAEAALERIDPESLSEEIFKSDSAQADRPERPFDAGWARHLFSGTGELLGLLFGVSDGPVLPFGDHATRIESICRLATLALEQSNLIAELTFQADHDSLTGLFNRGYYERELGKILQRSKPESRCTALLYINLDRFRLVNDVMGLSIGSRLLERVGGRFRAALRKHDTLARVGGDELAVVLHDVPREQAGIVAGHLLRALSRPFAIDGHELFISASIGIGCSVPESTPASLEREAYLALHQAKTNGKARAMYYHSSMAATPPERLEMEKRLRFALKRREMALFYQPQVELASGRVKGAEALLRWRPEGLGRVSPAAFIPILEETGLIVEFGRWVLGEACRQGKEWIDKHGFFVRIGVNVSAVQIASPDFVLDVQAALAETGFPPDLLELELTESLFVGDFAPARRVFEDLQQTGIKFALDDFGTGQSSLQYLDKLPFQRLKVDQSFIRGIADLDACPPLVQNIVRMAQSLKKTTIGEGVETAYQADLLRSLGCDEGQGYYFAKALAPADFTEFLNTYRGGPPYMNETTPALETDAARA